MIRITGSQLFRINRLVVYLSTVVSLTLKNRQAHSDEYFVFHRNFSQLSSVGVLPFAHQTNRSLHLHHRLVLLSQDA